jgi:hypothetical protein
MPELLSLDTAPDRQDTRSAGAPTSIDLELGAPNGRAPRPVRAALPRGSDALLLFAVLALATVLLALLRSAFSIDTWLELAVGRLIWQHGLPQHETLTVMAHGVRWVDQQWLGQLTAYVLARIGGLGLVGLVNVAMLVVGVGGAAVGARRLGARAATVMLVLPLCLWLLTPTREVRTQEFAVPLLVAIAYLLSTDSRRPSRRMYWCFPLLILWANLHGTATFGAGLVGLRGVTLAWERRSELLGSWRAWLRPLTLILGAPLCLLATPYGLHMLSYYRATLTNSALKHAVTEWQPITSSLLLALPLFTLAALAVWSFGRSPKRTTLWEKAALLMLIAASIDAARGVLLFALCALMILPVSLEGVSTRLGHNAPTRNRLNALLGAVVLFALLGAAGSTLLQPARYFEGPSQNQRVLDVVRAATRSDPALRVFADARYGDWLLWKDPALGGKLASDARFELLSSSQIGSLVRMFSAVGDWKQAARGYRLLVLYTGNGPTVRGVLAEPGRRVLYRDGDAVVVLRSRRATG